MFDITKRISGISSDQNGSNSFQEPINKTNFGWIFIVSKSKAKFHILPVLYIMHDKWVTIWFVNGHIYNPGFSIISSERVHSGDALLVNVHSFDEMTHYFLQDVESALSWNLLKLASDSR